VSSGVKELTSFNMKKRKSRWRKRWAKAAVFIAK
jgi:tRNA U34 5-methylaminomethyl-2-thiouridine-forming methyltransferase MnmC